MAQIQSVQSAGPARSFATRSQNEKLILSLIRRHREAAKAELARESGLSPTAVGAIIRQLEADDLVVRGAPQRGRIGQPSVPYAINPRGAYALGVKIGRRSVELALLNSALETVAFAERVHPYPRPEAVRDFTVAEGRRMLAEAGAEGRLAGMGVAAPSELWCWSAEMEAPDGALDAWQEADLSGAFEAAFGAPVLKSNDATTACAAQLAIDPTVGLPPEALVSHSFVYFFVGWFIGGGVVLDGGVFAGGRGNAGALGSMPVCPPDGDGAPEQLIRVASVFSLERALKAAGAGEIDLWGEGADWTALGPPLEAWLERAASGVAQAIAASAAVIDFDAAVIDGSFPEPVRTAFVDRVRRKFSRIDRQGLAPLTIAEGSMGRRARAVGAACLPLLSAFAVDEAALPRGGSARAPGAADA